MTGNAIAKEIVDAAFRVTQKVICAAVGIVEGNRGKRVRSGPNCRISDEMKESPV